MATLSAAELQKKLEGAPDPFPSLDTGITTTARPQQRNGTNTRATVDTSEVSFPSLAPSAATPTQQKSPSGWGSGPRLGPAVSAPPLATERFTLSAASVELSGRDGRPGTLQEALKQMSARHPKVRAEANTNGKTRQTEFFLKSESGKELERARRFLVSLVSPQVTAILNAPASTIATIIGPKGATLKQIRDQTNVKVDIPRKETVLPPQTNGNGAAHAASDDEEEEPVVPITIAGPKPMVEEAQGMLKAIIANKTSKGTQRVRDIPEHILPFIIARRSEFMAEAGECEINLTLNSSAREISATGDREAIGRVVEKIKSTIETLKTELTQFTIGLPKRQHRLLIGRAAEEIMAKSKCGIIVPRPEDSSDQITVWGNPNDFANGMAAIMQKANSQYIHEFPLPGPITLSKQIVTYMVKTQYSKTISSATPGVAVYTPSAGVVKTATSLSVDIVGEKSKVDQVVNDLSVFVANLMGGIKEVEVDWVLHKIIVGKYAKKIKQFHDNHNVRLFFPDESSEESAILLVYDPQSPNASKNPNEKSQHVAEVEKELSKLARDVADVKSELIPIESKWHSYVAGKDGTTLNAIIGEDKTLSIKIGKDAGGSTEDFVLVRGISTDVDRAVKEIHSIVEDAKNELIDNSFSTEFEINRDYVGRIVGSQGSAINKLRETLGVKVDFTDEVDEKEKESSKKKKLAVQKARVKIGGRKENVEEAKKRILAQVERLADETSEVLKISAQYHPSLIGPSGKYVLRLEDKYAVKITFPREAAEGGEGKTREPLKADEVLIKGGRKGVAGAKSEILEAVEFEKESNNVIKFTVPTKSVARILGRGGANINEIKDNTGAQIDLDKGEGEVTSITCRGSKKDIAAAKTAILAISEEVSQEVVMTVKIEQKFHRSIIGAGGQELRKLVARCGGPIDTRQQANLIRFPNQNEPSDEIRIRGKANVVNDIKKELEKISADLRDRVVLFVEVPSAQHRALIGRNGQHLNDLQKRTNAVVQFPGSRSYNQVGEAENASEFEGVDPANLVKVSGSKAACEKAIAELKASIKTPSATAPSTPAIEWIREEIAVPLKYHHFVAQQNNLFRTLRSYGVQVDQSVTPTRSALPTRPTSDVGTSSRIDEAEEDTTVRGIEWQVVPNYQGTEEGDSIWSLRARDEAGMEKAKNMIKGLIEEAQTPRSVGFLTLPDRSAFPRIVGTKGANVMSMREETGADITVSREDTTITIIGSESAIEQAKEKILAIHSNRGGRRGNY